jgi:glutaredoxin-dependent peroxiredoxin
MMLCAQSHVVSRTVKRYADSAGTGHDDPSCLDNPQGSLLMSIRIGETATPFTLPCKPGETIDLAQHIGREKVVLLFFPLAFSPVCTDEMRYFRDSWSEWETLGARIFGICVDSPFITEKFRVEHNIPFPILSDFNREAAAMYGALHDDLFGLKGVTKRAAFVINADGKLGYSWVTDDPRVQVPFDEIRAALIR